ncbi:uncharacterized protein ISCGN_008955 [Ixodes scapularis]
MPPSVHQSPARGRRQTPVALQWNCAGLLTRLAELSLYLQQWKIPILALCEAGLPGNRSIPGYFAYKNPSIPSFPNGSAAIYIQKAIPHHVVDVSDLCTVNRDLVAVRAEIAGRRLTIISIYVRPGGGAVEVAGLVDSLRTRITDPVVICGDWNAHHALWGDTREDARGRMLAEQFGEHNLVVANDGSPTFFRPPCTFSAIDVTAHSPEIPLSWRVAADTMGSDHFPVFIDIIGLQRPGVHEISVIHWDRFRDNLGRSTRPLLEAISDAAKEATIKASVPTSFPAPDLTLLNLCAARRRAQRLLQRKGGVTFKTLFNRIDAALRRYAKKCFKRQWDLICSSVDATTPARRIWRLMDSLSGKRMYSLPFASLALCMGKLQAALAEDFATLYAAAVSQPKPPCHADKTPFCMDAPFTESELRSALRASKRRGAPGPDGVTTQMLQNLPDSRLQELLSSFNDIWASSESPAVWRLAWVVPVLKSGKPAGDLSSYRPVSLTSCVAKLFERLVHARLIWWLEEHNLLPSNITGFRSRLSAQDSILDIVSAVQHAAASRKSTVAAFFDIQAAFDNVEPASVLAQLTSWGITGRVQGFLEGFLSDRSIQVKLSNTLSQSRPVQRGLPQGSVLSPLLFNIAIAGLPAALPDSRIPIGISMYADDLCFWDRTSADGQRGVVYKVQCGDCDATYIGETGRKRATRLKEHKRDVAKATHATRSKTELAEHCWTTGHSFDLDNATTLAREQRWGQRKLVESWFIRRDSSVCNTNRGPLPDVYGDVCDK